MERKEMIGMKSIAVDRRLFNTTTRWLFLVMIIAFISAAVLLILVFATFMSIFDIVLGVFFTGIVVFPLLIFQRFMQKRSEPISIGFDEEQVVVSYVVQTLEVPYNYITTIWTYGKKENPTIIHGKRSTVKEGDMTIFLGSGTGGEFGREMAEAFKKYMEERGHTVKVQKRYVGYFIRDYLYTYSVDD